MCSGVGSEHEGQARECMFLEALGRCVMVCNNEKVSDTNLTKSFETRDEGHQTCAHLRFEHAAPKLLLRDE